MCIYNRQCLNQYIVLKYHFHVIKLKKVLRTCLCSNQIKVIEKAEKIVFKFYLNFCKADEIQMKMIIIKLMKMYLSLEEECFNNQSLSAILNNNVIHATLNSDFILQIKKCLKNIFHSDLNENLNVEINHLDRSLFNTVIQKFIPASTTPMPEKNSSSNFFLITSSVTATSILVYVAFKMKARLFRIYNEIPDLFN